MTAPDPPPAAALARQLSAPRQNVRRRSVVARLLLAFVVLTISSALLAGWSFWALGEAAREAELLRDGYLPLRLALRELVALQDNYNAQLNHVTTARNSADARLWFDAARRGFRGRFVAVRERLAAAFLRSQDGGVREVGAALVERLGVLEREAEAQSVELDALFDELERPERARAEPMRDELVRRGSALRRELGELDERVQRNVDALLRAATARERWSLGLLAALGLLSVTLGAVMTASARRTLAPLQSVTARAETVARGDLTPRPAPEASDEIGVLAATFERMVRAIALANDELLAAERLATVGKMAARVTHEIRNPLSAMALNVDVLEDELGEGGDLDEARAIVASLRREIDRLTSLSEQYLSMARRGPDQAAPEELGRLVREVCEFARLELERASVTLRVEAPAAGPRVVVDAAQLRQALLNLLKNAREAMPTGGQVTVSVDARGADAVIMVDDDGPGVPDEVRARLFDPFFTTKRHGTGLGLAITRQIMEAHGGGIEWEPAPTTGTRFTLRLPLAPASGGDDDGP